MTKSTTVQDTTVNTKAVEAQEEEDYNPVYYIIESNNKYAISSDRKINKIRLRVKRWKISDKPFMKTVIQVMNQAGTVPIMELKAGRKGYSLIQEASKNEKPFGRCVKKCKRKSGKFLTNKEAKSVDQLLSTYAMK